MADERWGDIYGTLLPGTMPAVPRLDTPLVRSPKCPEHCARHHVEGRIGCPKGHGVAYHVTAHEWPWSEGHHWYSYVPVNGATTLTLPTCIDCGMEMTRR